MPATVMIDRLDVELEFPHVPVGNKLFEVDKAENFVREFCRTVHVTGASGQVTKVRSYRLQDGVKAHKLSISGNPASWFQCHNLFGDGRVPLLAPAYVFSVLLGVGLEITPELEDLVLLGAYKIKRIDLACNFRLPSTEHASSFLIEALQTMTDAERRKVWPFDDSIYIGTWRNKKRISKFYNKGKEMAARLRASNPYMTDAQRRRLLGHADGLIRFEVVLHEDWLREAGVLYVDEWRDETAEHIVRAELGQITIPQNVAFPVDLEPPFTRSEYYVYHQWKRGLPIEGYSKDRLRAIKRDLRKKYGIDVRKPRREAEDVCDLMGVGTRLFDIDLEDMIPDWAEVEGLYVDPERLMSYDEPNAQWWLNFEAIDCDDEGSLPPRVTQTA